MIQGAVQAGSTIGACSACNNKESSRAFKALRTFTTGHLQVGEPRHDHIHIQLCPSDGGLDEVRQVSPRVLQRAIQPQPRVRGHLQITPKSGRRSLFQIFLRVLQRAVQPQPRVCRHLQIKTG